MTVEERQEIRRILRDSWGRHQVLLNRVKDREVGPTERPAWQDGPALFPEVEAGDPYGYAPELAEVGS